jgi:hypothetical protein
MSRPDEETIKEQRRILRDCVRRAGGAVCSFVVPCAGDSATVLVGPGGVAFPIFFGGKVAAGSDGLLTVWRQYDPYAKGPVVVSRQQAFTHARQPYDGVAGRVRFEHEAIQIISQPRRKQ